MKILGVETSCDETALSLVDFHGDDSISSEVKFKVLGETLLSQAALHAEYGGVFPTLAKREHAKNLTPLFEKTLSDAGMLIPGESTVNSELLTEILYREKELLDLLVPFLATHQKPDIDALAVTVGPGLEPALWVGINFARAVSAAWNIPIIPVNHMEGHLLIALVEEGRRQKVEGSENSNAKDENIFYKLHSPNYPAVTLLVSGGHTELIVSEEPLHYRLLGETRDDAAGECFDKSARILGLPYPGGPEISKLAKKAREANAKSPVVLPRPMIHEKNFEFSFSGLKTSVKNSWAPEMDIAAFAREIEDAIVDVLISKTKRAIEETGAQSIIVSGGVSANTELKRRMELLTEGQGVQLYFPPRDLSTDNARMIALAGYLQRFSSPIKIEAQGQLPLGSSQTT